jgi:tyrosinase
MYEIKCDLSLLQLTVIQSTRHPTRDANNLFTISRNDLAIAAVQNLHNRPAEDHQCDLYRLMSIRKDFNSFAGSASTASTPQVQQRGNIENLHDDIHTAVGGVDTDTGGAGTFFYFYTSAFDPIFWMHHAMVDRMLVMYQVLNPDS